MKPRRIRGRRSFVVVLAVAALSLAMSGILYAHWTDQLDATIGVQTGTLDLEWGPAGTDDDGVVNDFGMTLDDDVTWPQVYDRWGPESSADPALPFAEDRYDKDVGKCYIGDDPLNPELLWVNATNAYPSYHCSLYTSVTNTETIPVKASFFELVVHAGPAGSEGPVDPARIVPLAEGKIGLLDEDLLELEMTLDIAEGIRCGTQIDPGETMPVSGWFHVEQGAGEMFNYGFYMHQQFMNWNEWTPDFCSPGAVIANPDGSIPYTP